MKLLGKVSIYSNFRHLRGISHPGYRLLSNSSSAIHESNSGRDPVGKRQLGKWTKFGLGLMTLSIISFDVYYFLYHRQVINCLDQDEYQEFQVSNINQINHDTYIIDIKTRVLELIRSQPIPCPAHVSVKDDSCQIARSYTPIKIEKDSIKLLVKRYPNGSVSRMLTSLKEGDKVWLRGLIPTFSYTPNRVNHLVMIAGGTGITPMYQLASSVLESDQITKITLLYANKSINDILLKSELDEMDRKYSNFNVRYTIENWDSDWNHGKGRISKSDLEFSTESTAVIICGPSGFIEAIAGPKLSQEEQGPLGGYLKELGFNNGQVLKL